MGNLRRAGLTLLIMAVVVLSIALARREPVIKLVPVQSDIPSAREIQQRLKDTGKARYNPGKVDGIIGTDSRTAWDNYECDKQAIKAF